MKKKKSIPQGLHIEGILGQDSFLRTVVFFLTEQRGVFKIDHQKTEMSSALRFSQDIVYSVFLKF